MHLEYSMKHRLFGETNSNYQNDMDILLTAPAILRIVAKASENIGYLHPSLYISKVSAYFIYLIHICS